MKQEKSCGVIVYYKEKFLLIQHRNGGHWAFPKGHVEAGETEEETALREVLEETGLRVQLKGNFRESTSYSPKRGIKKEVVYFLGEATTFEVVVQKEEVTDYLWVETEETNCYLTFDNDKKIAKKARDILKRPKH